MRICSLFPYLRRLEDVLDKPTLWKQIRRKLVRRWLRRCVRDPTGALIDGGEYLPAIAVLAYWMVSKTCLLSVSFAIFLIWWISSEMKRNSHFSMWLGMMRALLRNCIDLNFVFNQVKFWILLNQNKIWEILGVRRAWESLRSPVLAQKCARRGRPKKVHSPSRVRRFLRKSWTWKRIVNLLSW